ncbi:MAG: hypothetical protein LBF60_00615 [Treponema sp.]|jgi:hypothetical protein|nr:hypothetical protein [Treponema sp.]
MRLLTTFGLYIKLKLHFHNVLPRLFGYFLKCLTTEGALAHKQSNSKETMPQSKNLTLINSSGGGIGGHYGVAIEHEKGVDRGVALQYRQADRKKKSGILDEYLRLTGYHRKYALALLAGWGKGTFLMADGKPVKLKTGTAKRWKGGGRKPVYGIEVIASIRTIRAFFWYRCGRTEGPKLLPPLIREQMPFFEAWPPLSVLWRRSRPNSCG